MHANHNAAVHEIPSARENQKVEVVLEDGERFAIRYLTWTEGLGWCCQKTIRLDAAQLDELHLATTVARHRLNRRRAEVGQSFEPATVVKLPYLR